MRLSVWLSRCVTLTKVHKLVENPVWQWQIPFSCSAEPPYINILTQCEVIPCALLYSYCTLVHPVKNRQLTAFYHSQTYILRSCICFTMNIISPEHLIWDYQPCGVKQFKSSERVTCFHRGFTVFPCQLLPISDGIIHWLHRVKAPWPAPPSQVINAPAFTFFSRSSAAKYHC